MFKKYQLKNGLRVLLVESHKSPVVSVQAWVHVGSADEPKRMRGVSHFIEHLVFKGTKHFGVGEIAGTVEGSGGVLNAYTSFDQTVFYVTISSQFSQRGLEVISQMMGCPTFDVDEVDREREVVVEEIKRSNDSPHRQASRLLFSSLFRKHPYGEPVIGYEDIIRKIKTTEIRNYFQRHYVPSNMTLLVVGDFQTGEMQRLVQQYFGPLRRRKRILKPRPKEPKSQGRVVAQKSQFNEGSLFLAWPIPSAKHKDVPTLDVLSMILGQGDSSRLNRKLRMETGLVNAVGAGTFTPKDSGFMTISVSLNMDNLGPVLRELISVLRQALSAAPRSDELRRVIVGTESEEYYSLETVDGMARKFGHFEHLFNDYRYFDRFMKRLEKMTPDEVFKVARKYLQPKALSAVCLSPRPAEEVEAMLLQFKAEYSALFKEAMKVGLKSSAPRLAKGRRWYPAGLKRLRAVADRAQKVTLSSGAQVLFRPNFDTPVVSLRLAFLGGARIEPQGKQGLNQLVSRGWVSATSKQSEEELLGKIEKIAASLSAYGGRNSCGLSLTSLWPFSMEALGLLGEVVTDAVIEPRVVDREKAIIVEQIRQRSDSPAQVAILNFMETLFKDHPYGRDPLGSKESLSLLDATDVMRYLARFVSAKNATFSIAGCFNPDRWLPEIETLTKSLPKGARRAEILPFHPPTEPAVYFEHSQKEQTHIVVGYSGLTLSDPSRYTLQVLEAILSGQGGRLFVELRDKASLAYTVSPLRMEGIDAGYFGAYIGCSPEKAKTAIDMLRVEFGKLRGELVGESEVQRAKQYLIGHHDIDLQKNGAVASSMLFDDIYGIDFHETFCFPERIQSVTAAQIRDLANRLFAQPEVLSVVGPSAPL